MDYDITRQAVKTLTFFPCCFTGPLSPLTSKLNDLIHLMIHPFLILSHFCVCSHCFPVWKFTLWLLGLMAWPDLLLLILSLISLSSTAGPVYPYTVNIYSKTITVIQHNQLLPANFRKHRQLGSMGGTIDQQVPNHSLLSRMTFSVGPVPFNSIWSVSNWMVCIIYQSPTICFDIIILNKYETWQTTECDPGQSPHRL